jgi:hypothetical protein
MEVGNEISSRVVVASPWAKGHVGREALRGRQPRTFTDQKHHDGWIQDFADVIEHSHTAMSYEKRLTKLPVPQAGFRRDERKQHRHLNAYRSCRKPIGDCHLKVDARSTSARELALIRPMECAAQVWFEQEFRLGSGLCRHLEKPPFSHESLAQVPREIEFVDNGIASGGVIASELEPGRRSIRAAYLTGQDACRRARSNFLEREWK